ncbi:MAG TPA: AIR synthase-related protein, partial [bacterium]
VLVNGPIGRHGMAVVTARSELGFEDRIRSDVAPLNHMVAAVLDAVPEMHAMRDATRGGLAAVLNEIAVQSGVAVELDEAFIPLDEDVRGACELLGFDPLYVANEGVMVFILPESRADDALRVLRGHPYGRSAVRIGNVLDGAKGRVVLKTRLGSHRIVDMPSGELLPRIC